MGWTSFGPDQAMLVRPRIDSQETPIINKNKNPTPTLGTSTILSQITIAHCLGCKMDIAHNIDKSRPSGKRNFNNFHEKLEKQYDLWLYEEESTHLFSGNRDTLHTKRQKGSPDNVWHNNLSPDSRQAFFNEGKKLMYTYPSLSHFSYHWKS